MNKKSIKHLKLLMAMFVLFVAMAIPVTSHAMDPTSGSCGKNNGQNIQWMYVPSSKLMIFAGNGEMENYTATEPAQWNSYDVKKISILDGITSIGDYAFYNLGNLEEVTIPDSVLKLGNGAFGNCQKLKKLGLSKTSKCITIGAHAYENCIGIESLTLPASVKFIQDYAFSATSFDEIKIPATVQVVGPYAFSCASLAKADINAKYISNNAFEHNLILDTVTFGTNVTSIGYSAFFDCPDLETVTLKPTVKTIEDFAFGYVANEYNIYEKADIFALIGEKDSATFKYACNFGIEFRLNGLAAPKNVKAYNVSKRKIQVKWSKDKKYSGYQICYSLDSDFELDNKYITVKSYKTTSKKTAKLLKKHTYYVRVRGYKKIAGKYCYSSWSTVKKVKIKK